LNPDRCFRAAQELIKAGADLTAVNIKGETPIYIIKGNVPGSKTITSNNFFGGGNVLEINF
jgi:hypothetical protein